MYKGRLAVSNHVKSFKQVTLSLGSSKGFTLIEVVLVLAIGGLIFLLAFLAFGQASRNRRDTQRKSDASLVAAQAINFLADTGRLPTNCNVCANLGEAFPCTSPANANFSDFSLTFANDPPKDPKTGGLYRICFGYAATSRDWDGGLMYYVPNHSCKNGAGEKTADLAAAPGSVAIVYSKESGKWGCAGDI